MASIAASLWGWGVSCVCECSVCRMCAPWRAGAAVWLLVAGAGALLLFALAAAALASPGRRRWP